MSATYDSQSPPVSPLGGPADAGRNRLVQAMMQVQQPPGGLASLGLPGLPPELGQQDMMSGQAPASAAPGMGGQPGMAMNLGLPQPGQLPQNMAPSAALTGAGTPPLSMPPR